MSHLLVRRYAAASVFYILCVLLSQYEASAEAQEHANEQKSSRSLQ